MVKKLLIALATLLMLASCEKDPFEAFLEQESYENKTGLIFDFYPIEFVFRVTNAQGQNLFDESTPNNWLSKTFYATFDGKDYFWPPVPTKHYLAVLKGFYIYPQDWYPEPVEALLRFGELDRTKKWDTSLHLFWPDGSKDVIKIQNAMRWNEEGEPEFYTAIKPNGNPVENYIIDLKK